MYQDAERTRRIAAMVKNVSTNPACRANLVIAPTALLEQWKNEIEAKTNANFKVLIYHGRVPVNYACSLADNYN